MEKFELTSETRRRYDDGAVMHRIRALREITCQHRTVKPGELGGWLEKESNLSQDGECWVDGNACVTENAFVSGNAVVKDSAEVYGRALVSDNACVSDDTCVGGNAMVAGNAVVKDSAWVLCSAEVSGNAIVRCDSVLGGTVDVAGNAVIDGDESLVIDGSEQFAGNAHIKRKGEWLHIGPIVEKEESEFASTFSENITFFRNHGELVAKIHNGAVFTCDELIKSAVAESKRRQYEIAVQLAIATLGGGEEANDAEKPD